MTESFLSCLGAYVVDGRKEPGEYVVDGRVSRVCGSGVYVVEVKVSIAVVGEALYVVDGRNSKLLAEGVSSPVAARRAFGVGKESYRVSGEI